MASGSFSGVYKGFTFRTDWSSTSNIAGNYSTITCNHYLVIGQYYSLYINGRTNYCTVNGETKSFSSPAISAGSATTIHLGSTSYTVYHNADGKKSVSASATFYIQATIAGTYVDSISSSGTMTLDNIPRYATSNQSVNSKTETSITMDWSSDSTIDYVWYSTDWGTTWKAVGSVNAKSGSYTISTQSKDTSSLSANTTYNVITRVRRKDSQLTTNSSKLSVTTHDYPHCIESPNFTIGNALTISLYNPLGRSVTIKGIAKSNNASIFGATNVTGTSAKGFNDSDSVAVQYASIPNAKSGAYKVEVTYGSITKTRDNGNTYSIKGTEKPTIGSITYADTNTTVTAITGNNQHIVQNYSNLKVTYAKATAKNSASISKYTFVLNGVTKESTSAGGTIDFGKINSAKDLTLSVTVTDSRGLTSSTTKTITMLAHSSPTAIVTLNRLNNYEDESYLTVDGSIASVNGKNTMTIKYRYKVSGGSYGSYTTIGDRVKQTLSLDKNNAYIFNIVVTDAFGSSISKEYTLEKGKFPLFIDIEKNAVGINEFPNEGEALRVKDGDIVLEKALNGSPRMKVSNGSVSASLHVGAGGVNRGVWDDTDNKWMVYNDGKDVYLNSNLYPMARGYNNEPKNAEIFDDVAEGESFYRSGLYSVNDSTAWYNVINIRHRNGYSDGLDYGLQIRKAFGLNATMQVRSQNSKAWAGWEAIYRAKTLYNNASGSNGTITLNESVANFTHIEIFAKVGNVNSSVKVQSPDGKAFSLVLKSAETSLLQLDAIVYVISGTTFTIHQSQRVNIGNSHLAPWDATNIYVTKVVGYR